MAAQTCNYRRNAASSLFRLLSRQTRIGSILALSIGLAAASSLPATAQMRDFSARVVESGHSLTDPIPPMLARMVMAAGGEPHIVRSTIPGSTMDWRRENPTEPLPNAWTGMSHYDVLVLTERVPLSNTMPWHNSDKEALRWVEHAWEAGRGGEGAATILYATWVQITSGPDFENPYNDPEGDIVFRERLPMEWERWETIAAYVNENRPEGAPFVPTIPGPLLFAALHDAISNGTAPGLSDIQQLFLDDIHINELGAYFIALAHYAVIYGKDPRGLPANLGQAKAPDAELATFMQDMVWQVLTSYSGSGLAN